MRQKFTLICVPTYISASPNLLKANTGQAQTQYKKEVFCGLPFYIFTLLFLSFTHSELSE